MGRLNLTPNGADEVLGALWDVLPPRVISCAPARSLLPVGVGQHCIRRNKAVRP